MIYGKYKPGQIVTLKYFNIRYVCKVAKSTNGCTACYFNDWWKGCMDKHCFYNIGTCVYKLIRRYYVKERSNESTKY